MKPKLNLSASHHAVQSSLSGTIYVQGGWVFDEGGNLIGGAPAWAPPITYDAFVTHAKAHPFVEKPEPASVADDVDDMVEVERPKGVTPVLNEKDETPQGTIKRGPGRPRKESYGSGYGSGSV